MIWVIFLKLADRGTGCVGSRAKLSRDHDAKNGFRLSCCKLEGR